MNDEASIIEKLKKLLSEDWHLVTYDDRNKYIALPTKHVAEILIVDDEVVDVSEDELGYLRDIAEKMAIIYSEINKSH